VRDAAVGFDGAGLGEDQTGAADGELGQVGEMPVVRQPVGRAVLAHGRDHDPVGQGDAAQLERGEEQCL
jgi:hypothetical protein